MGFRGREGRLSGRFSALTLRAVALAFLLNAVFTCVSAYLQINFGMGLGFGMVTIVTAYFLFRKMGGTSRQEVTATMVMATGGSGVAQMIAFNILFRMTTPSSNLPTWLVPSAEVLESRRILCIEWLLPVLVNVVFLSLVPTLLGLILGWAVREVVLRNRRMVFPGYQVNAAAVNACFEGGRSAKRLFTFLLLGAGISTLQYVLKALGIEALSFDFTPRLPTGFAFGFLLNLAIIATGCIISAEVSLSILASGLFLYFVLAPILVDCGVVSYVNSGMEFYFNLLTGFTLSPALGAMLLGGALALVFGMARRRGRKEVSLGEGERGLSLLEFASSLRNVLREPRMAVAFAGSVLAMLLYAALFNFLYPFPIWVALLYTLLFILPFGIIDAFIQCKMSGEVGMNIGIYKPFLYSTTILASGYKGYTAHLAYPTASPWIVASLNGNLKIGEMTGTDERTILKASLLSIIPRTLASLLFILVVWRYVGLLNETFPCITFYQVQMFVRMFSERTLKGVINPTTFLAGGVLSALLSMVTPISIMGLAVGLFLPPSYILTFGIGGLLRLYLDRRYGKEWFMREGIIAATGFIAGALIAQLISITLMAASG